MENYIPELSKEDIMEMLSIAYIRAVAAILGMSVQEGPKPDRNSIDITIHAKFDDPKEELYFRQPELHIQVKATCQKLKQTKGFFCLDLPAKNYDDFRVKAHDSRRIIVVLLLPPDQQEWLTVTPEEMVVRRCAHWVSIQGAELRKNKFTCRIKIPVAQLFTPESLLEIMKNTARGD